MTKLLIADTADVTVKRKSDDNVFISAETQLASISSSLGIDEKVFGGIGNKALAIFKGQKNIESKFKNAFYDNAFLAMTQGVAVKEDGSATVYKKENDLKVTDNAGALEVTITGTPVGTTVYVTNAHGETESTTVATKVVTVPVGHAVAGDLVAVSYQATVTGDIVELDATKFAEAYTIEYHTIGYDPTTNKVVKDIYIQLDHVVPKGDFELSFEAGTPIAPEITFDVLSAPNSNQMGRVIEVDRP